MLQLAGREAHPLPVPQDTLPREGSLTHPASAAASGASVQPPPVVPWQAQLRHQGQQAGTGCWEGVWQCSACLVTGHPEPDGVMQSPLPKLGFSAQRQKQFYIKFN